MKTLKVIILLSLVTYVNTAFSQCQPVCIESGTVTITPSGTLNVNVVNTPTVHVNNTTFTVVPSGTQTTVVTNTVSISVVGTPTVHINNTTFTVTGASTAVDSIAAGVLIGNNNSSNAKQTTLNQLLNQYFNGGGNSPLFDTISGKKMSIANVMYTGLFQGNNPFWYNQSNGSNLFYDASTGRGVAVSIGVTNNFISDNYSISDFEDNGDQSVFKAGNYSGAANMVSAFITPRAQGGKAYGENISMSDTVITDVTSMASLVTAVNLFYAQHPYRRIADCQYSNAVITATLTFFAVIRYKD